MSLWSWIRRDGLLHIETCALVAVISGLFLPWWGASILACVAGIGKELYDIKHGVANWHDVICDIIGIAIGTIILLIGGF